MIFDRRIFALATASALSLTTLGCGSSASSSTTTTADAPASGSAQTQAAAPQEAAPAQSDYAVTIDGVQLASDYEGNPCVGVTFTFTNNSDEATMFQAAVNPEVYQNGVSCEMAISSDIDTSAALNKVKPGASNQLTLAYSLKDLSDIDVEVSELWSLDPAMIASQTFSLQ